MDLQLSVLFGEGPISLQSNFKLQMMLAHTTVQLRAILLAMT